MGSRDSKRNQDVAENRSESSRGCIPPQSAPPRIFPGWLAHLVPASRKRRCSITVIPKTMRVCARTRTNLGSVAQSVDHARTLLRPEQVRVGGTEVDQGR